MNTFKEIFESKEMWRAGTAYIGSADNAVTAVCYYDYSTAITIDIEIFDIGDGKYAIKYVTPNSDKTIVAKNSNNIDKVLQKIFQDLSKSGFEGKKFPKVPKALLEKDLTLLDLIDVE